MAAYPSIGSYDLAVRNLDRFILAPQFIGGSPVLTPKKQILGYSGGYSVVYPINVNGKKLALRCWIKDPGNVKERYVRVKKYLQSHPTSYLVDFDYVDKGIVVDGHQYPISYMEWIEGKTLSQFIDQNINDADTLNMLADQFLVMVKELHSKNISHGDLQDGNIMVTQNSSAFELKLVDYDSLYAPTLQNWNIQDDLQGVADYQHPKRYPKSNEKADYFSELVIYLSLIAYSEQPNLWKKGQEKRLLFTADDFRNPSGSITFRALEMLSPRVKNLADKLKEFCLQSDTNLLLPLESVISGNLPPRSGATLQDFFSIPPSSTKTVPPPSPNPSLSQYFPPTPKTWQPSKPNVPYSPPVVNQSAKKSWVAPIVVVAIILAVMLALLILGAIVLSVTNMQNTHAAQTVVAQNRAATAIAQNQTATAIYNHNVQSTKTAVAQSKTATAQSALFYSEDFNYAPEWEWLNNDGVGFVVENGKIKGNATGSLTAWTFAGQSFKDIKIEVDIRKISGTDINLVGAICNATDNRHFYAFVIGTDQTYMIWKQKGDSKETLVGWSNSLIINKGNGENHLTAICDGGNLTLLVNGVELTSVYDTSYLQGDVGIIIGSFEENKSVSAYFDNFNVSNS